jgi:murein DD-endopeptidase MepM/ murein hydrolase activator NlpD
MSKRNWTILIVPPDNAGTRTYVVSERARRYALSAAIAAGALVAASVITMFTPWATPAARVLAAENARLRRQLAQIDVRLAALDDTLAALGQRDQQIRLMAGLSADTAVATRPSDSARATELAGAMPSTLPRPFLGRLGFGNRPDIDGVIRRATELAASFRAVSDTLTRNFERLANTPSIMPTTGWLSSQFSLSRFHPILHENRAHEGIDLQAPMGAPIIAPAAGRVISAGREPGFGNTFEVDHGNGIITRFAHCSRIVVRVGQMVTRGQVMATVGNTGLATGPHLHYEVHVNGKAVDPLKYVLPGKIAE